MPAAKKSTPAPDPLVPARPRGPTEVLPAPSAGTVTKPVPDTVPDPASPDQE